MTETPLPDDQQPRPVHVRNTSLAILATLACLVALRLASPLFIPLLLGLMLSYALSPVDRKSVV